MVQCWTLLPQAGKALLASFLILALQSPLLIWDLRMWNFKLKNQVIDAPILSLRFGLFFLNLFIFTKTFSCLEEELRTNFMAQAVLAAQQLNWYKLRFCLPFNTKCSDLKKTRKLLNWLAKHFKLQRNHEFLWLLESNKWYEMMLLDIFRKTI